MTFSPADFFNQSCDPLFVLSFASQGGPLVAANPALARLLGQKVTDIEGAPFAAFMTEASMLVFQASLASAQRGEVVRFHVVLHGVDGSEHPIDVSGTPSLTESVLHCVGRRALWANNDVPGQVPRNVLFQNIVHGLLESLHVRHVLVCRAVGWPVVRSEVVAASSNGQMLEPFVYDVEGTPCNSVLHGQMYSCPEGVQAAFPNDYDLVNMGAESYLGVPIKDEVGAILGHICILDNEPMAPATEPQRVSLLEAAGRAATQELARMRTETLLAMGADSATAPLEGARLIHAITRQAAIALQADVIFASEFENSPTHAKVLSLWDGKNHTEGIRYSIENTSCAIVARGEVCQIPNDAMKVFSGNPVLERIEHMEAVIAVPMLDSRGNLMGAMTLLSSRPLAAIDERALSLRLFGGRIAAEMERMRAARAAADSDARFRLLVEYTADMLFVHARDGTILECNPAAGRELLAATEDLIAKNLADIRYGMTVQDVAREGALLEVGEARTVDAVFQRSDGTTFPAEMRTVLFDHAGKQFAISSARDVTEQKKSAALLEAALAAMSTPIIEVWEKTVALPVIGIVDRDRATRMMLALLDTIAEKQAEYAILDLTGVTTVDAETAHHLLDIARAASLLGSDCIISGISPAVARTLVDLGATETSAFRTFSTLEAALRYALGQRNVRIFRR